MKNRQPFALHLSAAVRNQSAANEEREREKIKIEQQTNKQTKKMHERKKDTESGF